MSKKLKTNNNNTSSSKVPRWSSSSEEEEGQHKLPIILEGKSPKKIIILERGEIKVSKKSSGTESNPELQPKMNAADHASSSSKGEPISSPPNLEKDSSGRLVIKTATQQKEEIKLS
jgi:hypothetical protein